MSSEEKRTWISAVVGLAVPAVYLSLVLSRVPGTDVTRIAYVRPMLVSVGIGVVAAVALTMLTTAVTSVGSPEDADRTDERDREINQRGEYVGFYVMSIAAIAPLVLAMAEVAHFWIAHALYLSFVLAALASATVKLVSYRRGW
jgi:hypothetical protein